MHARRPLGPTPEDGAAFVRRCGGGVDADLLSGVGAMACAGAPRLRGRTLVVSERAPCLGQVGVRSSHFLQKPAQDLRGGAYDAALGQDPF